MRKEIILAIILGLILGAVIVFGYYRTNSISPVPGESPQITISPTIAPANQGLLLLTAPQDGDIFSEPVATISGTTLSSARIVIVSENEQLFVKPSPNGYFNQEITLDSGLNTVLISAIDINGDRADKTINLVFTTELDL